MKYEDTPKYWDCLASESLKTSGREAFRDPGLAGLARWYSFVVTRGIALSHGLEVLKLDLWNEVVDRNRDVLSHLTSSRPSHRFHALDISSFMVSEAKVRLGKLVNLLQGDLLHMPYRDSSFDLLLDLSTLDHIDYRHLDCCLNEYDRVLRDYGILVLIFNTDHKINREVFARRRNEFYFNVGSLKTRLAEYFDILEEYAFWDGLIPLVGIEYSEYTTRFKRKMSLCARRPYLAIYEPVVSLLKRFEQSRRFSKSLRPICRMYCILARKNV